MQELELLHLYLKDAGARAPIPQARGSCMVRVCPFALRTSLVSRSLNEACSSCRLHGFTWLYLDLLAQKST
jgi:hypothetical protein